MSAAKQFAIKGGVNLRFFFKSPRYSEDMDIDAFFSAPETLKKNGYKILKDQSFLRVLKTYGIVEIKINDPSKAKHTETTQRFRVRLIDESGVAYPTKIEFSRRRENAPESDGLLHSLIDPEIISTYRRPNFLCPHYSASEAALQKVKALAGRNEPQTRDVFDLHLLLSSHCPKLKPEKKNNKLAIENLMSMTFEDYTGQVVEFLSEEYKKQYSSRNYWNHITDQTLEWLTHG